MAATRTRGRKPRLTERQVQAQVIGYLRALGVDIDRQNVGGMKWTRKDGREAYVRFGRSGAPDLTGTLRGSGRRLEIETKATGEKPRPDQMAYIHRINDLGGVAFWCDDVATCMKVMQRVLEGYSVRYERGDDEQIYLDPPG